MNFEDFSLKKILIYMLITIIIFLSFFYWIFFPQKKLYSSLNKEKKLKEKVLNYTKNKIKEIDIYKKDINDITEKIVVFRKKLISEEDIPNLINDINVLCKENKIEVISINRGEQQIKENYMEIPLEINIQSGYHNLEKFTNLLRRAPWIINIDDININTINNKNNPEITNNAKIHAFVYIKSQKKSDEINEIEFSESTFLSDLVIAKGNEKVLENTSNIENYLKSFDYKVEGRRDPFKSLIIPEVKVQKPEIKKEIYLPKKEEKTVQVKKEYQKPKPQVPIKIPDYQIQGILWNPSEPLLMLKNNDRIFKEGMFIDSEKTILIRKIDNDSIILEKTESGITVTKKIGIHGE